MSATLTILYGHRGVGKSALLRRIPKYIPAALCFCLDDEIEKQRGPIANLFREKGEPFFRETERQIFSQILDRVRNEVRPVFVAVGGGFEGEFPAGARRLWVKRDWDVSKDIHFDRPSLNSQANDVRIPLELFEAREKRFQSLGGDELTLPEGVYESHPGEKAFFLRDAARGAITILPEHFYSERLQTLQMHQVDFLELRDDLLSQEQIQRAIKTLPLQNFLLSFRDHKKVNLTSQWVSSAAIVDWPLDFGQIPFEVHLEKLILSFHSEEENFYDAFEMVEGVERPIKWSPVVKSFLQLRLGHEWMMRAPQKRFFLPRSDNGRWAWYRHWQKNKMKLNFWREGFGSSLDQPTMVQWHQPVHPHFFAAVLGNPVLQSWSPAFHADFFAQRAMSLYAIEIDEDDLRDGGFDFLKKCGLVAAAVTSPLKLWAAEVVGAARPLNTLVRDSRGGWQGFSTDAQGFAETLKQANVNLTGQAVAVWGGGGVLPSLALQEASYYSARSGKPRDASSEKKQVDILIWSAGWQSIEMLPQEWKPQMVIDLNYRADSPAKRYAFQKNAKYISGETMFTTQAREQQNLWSKYEWSE